MGERLAWARKKAGFRSARAAALDNEWVESTYRSHETGGRGFDFDWATRYGRVFKVDPVWLLHGVVGQSRQSDRSIPIMGRIGAGAIIEPEFEQVPEDGLDQVELPFAVPPDLIGFEVQGDSMLPRYEAGDVIVVWREPRGAAEALLGEEAAVRTNRGQRYIKRLLRGSGKGTFNLESTNASAKTIEGVRLDWWSEIYLTVRAAQLRRVAQRERARRHSQTTRHVAADTGELPPSRKRPRLARPVV